MRRLALLALVLGLFAHIPANAQTILVYGTAAPTHLDHLYTLTNATPPQSEFAGMWFEGFNAGVTLNFSTSSPVDLGFDFRGGPELGTPGLGSALAGFKVAKHSPIFHVKPYGQFSLGFLEQHHITGSGAALTKDAEGYVAAELLGGLDYPVTSHLDIRAVELGVGETHTVITNGLNTNEKPAVFSINSGLVLHF